MMSHKEYKERCKKYKIEKKNLSKFDIIDASADVMIESEGIKKLMSINPTLILTLTMYTSELVDRLFGDSDE